MARAASPPRFELRLSGLAAPRFAFAAFALLALVACSGGNRRVPKQAPPDYEDPQPLVPATTATAPANATPPSPAASSPSMAPPS